jgi:3-dehydroquinate dehydratase-1
MKIIAALTDVADASRAEGLGADMIELRLDLMDGDPSELVRTCRQLSPLPVIATLRSVQEGGRYGGDAGAWLAKMAPVIPLADYVDVEQKFSVHAHAVRDAKKRTIASFHTGEMPTLPELFALERHLRTFGDIVKIVVTPASEAGLIDLITFTHAVSQPLCTGVMGERFRYARAILPLFGSELAYCTVGRGTAAGQYSVTEFKELMRLLTG